METLPSKCGPSLPGIHMRDPTIPTANLSLDSLKFYFLPRYDLLLSIHPKLSSLDNMSPTCFPWPCGPKDSLSSVLLQTYKPDDAPPHPTTTKIYEKMSLWPIYSLPTSFSHCGPSVCLGHTKGLVVHPHEPHLPVTQASASLWNPAFTLFCTSSFSSFQLLSCHFL